MSILVLVISPVCCSETIRTIRTYLHRLEKGGKLREISRMVLVNNVKSGLEGLAHPICSIFFRMLHHHDHTRKAIYRSLQNTVKCINGTVHDIVLSDWMRTEWIYQNKYIYSMHDVLIKDVINTLNGKLPIPLHFSFNYKTILAYIKIDFSPTHL